MIPRNTKQIINYLLRNLELTNINQISRKLKISVGSTFKILKNLEEKEIVTSTNLGNAKYFQINLNSEEAKKISELILLEQKRNLEGYSKLYANELKKFKAAKLIILFGSILSNKNFNDVDVLFITNKPKEVTKFCLELSKIRTKPVIPLILKEQDIIKELKNKKEVIMNIIKTGVILKGESIFIKIIKNAQPKI